MTKKEHAGGRDIKYHGFFIKISQISEPFFHVSEDCLIVARLHKSAYFSKPLVGAERWYTMIVHSQKYRNQ